MNSRFSGLLLIAVSAFGATNEVVITNRAGVQQDNRPFSISRVFKQGEISGYAQPVIDGTPAGAWQCDVKTRWRDGTVVRAVSGAVSSGAPFNRVRLTIEAHGFRNGERVTVADVDGVPAANGTWRAVVVDSDHVDLAGTTWQGSYTTGGTAAGPTFGSLQHAIISFQSTLADSGSITVSFTDSATPCSAADQAACEAAALDQAGLLAFSESSPGAGDGWGARIQVTAGSTLGVSARAMVASGNWRYWLRGPVVTEVIIEETSPALDYDMGWGGFAKQLHPVFIGAFYAGWAGVKFSAALENKWSTVMADASYSVEIDKAADFSSVVYARNTFTHHGRTGWRKIFWDGAAPGDIKLDLNKQYMIESYLIPNYDPNITVDQSSVTAEVNAYNATDLNSSAATTDNSWKWSHNVDFNDSGQWNKYFPSTGGRPDIAYLPRWAVRYLYTFDPDAEKVMLANAEVSAHIPFHIREGRYDATKKYCLVGNCAGGNENVVAFDYPVSIDSRPTLWVWSACDNFRWNYSGSSPDDRMPTNGCTEGGWTVDLAHQGSFVFLPYMVTGDYWFLRELSEWAHWNVTFPNFSGGGRTGSWGLINRNDMQLRGVAWGLRTLGHAAFAVPDGDPQKEFLISKLEKNAQALEGMLGITNGSYPPPDSSCAGWPTEMNIYGWNYNEPWCIGFAAWNHKWARTAGVTYAPERIPVNDFGYMKIIGDQTTSADGANMFMQFFFQTALKSLGDLGFTSLYPAFDALAKTSIAEVRSPESFSYYASGGGYHPAMNVGNTRWLNSLAEVRQGWRNGTSTLTAAIPNASAASVVVADGSVFDGNGAGTWSCGTAWHVLLRIENERMFACARTGNTLTIDVRGALGTTATSHPVGAIVEHDPGEFWYTVYPSSPDAYSGNLRAVLAQAVDRNISVNGIGTAWEAYRAMNLMIGPSRLASSMNSDPKWAIVPRSAEPSPSLVTDNNRLQFFIQPGAASNTSKPLQASCSGPCSIAASSDSSWCGVNPSSLSNSGTFSVTASAAGLAPGAYECRLTLSALGSDLRIPVSLTVLSGGTTQVQVRGKTSLSGTASVR